jgi:putative nucleotidyltransferase with HDIG domain
VVRQADPAARLLPPPAKLPSLPLVYTRLRAALEDPRSSTSTIADILSQDAALTARLLRLVNSVFYMPAIPVETVSRAVLLVGTEQIHDLALATLVVRMFEGVPADLVDVTAFWQHSLATGVTSRVLAAYRGEPNVERFFVAGLLHDVGHLVLYQREPAACRDMLRRCHRHHARLVELEREAFGADHAAVGGALLRAWQLPASFQDVVAHHHEPAAGSSEHALEIAIVHVADVIAHAMRIGNSGDPRVPPLDATAWEYVGLAPGALGSVLTEVDRQVEAARTLLAPGAAA